MASPWGATSGARVPVNVQHVVACKPTNDGDVADGCPGGPIQQDCQTPTLMALTLTSEASGSGVGGKAEGGNDAQGQNLSSSPPHQS
jgi:hypothetical protein|mmetsp:Transcript_69873/g.117329  ORF Transcript_69873/g.117329 Transcript_69873/m.117329 type:complete len:87 (+) Transcript_69873:390-650(+)